MDQVLSVLSEDLATLRFEGCSELPGAVRDFGLSKDRGVSLKFMLGDVQPSTRLPNAHWILQGITDEAALSRKRRASPSFLAAIGG